MRFEADGLVVRYRAQSRPALDGVSMRVPEGCLYCVLGPNGSGKSTLMRALVGPLSVASGAISIDGIPRQDWTRRELARSVGVVTQSESPTFPISVRELVAMGRYPRLGPFQAERRDDREAVERALADCDAVDLAHRDVGTLSGGEFQRVRIARAIAQEPRALVLDEPTASLDLAHEMAILRLLREATTGGITVVLITHHIDLAARFGDRLLLLDGGRVAAEGTVDEVVREDILERVYGWRVAVRTNPVTGQPTVTPLLAGQ
jgi:iron complex transport system ATP-binding protein